MGAKSIGPVPQAQVNDRIKAPARQHPLSGQGHGQAVARPRQSAGRRGQGPTNREGLRIMRARRGKALGRGVALPSQQGVYGRVAQAPQRRRQFGGGLEQQTRA